MQLAGNLLAVLSQCLCPRVDTDGMVAAYEFMYVTPGIQNLIRENKSFRIDSEIQTGKRFGMQLLDDNLWGLFQAGKISRRRGIDKSRNPGQIVDKMQRAGLNVEKADDALVAEAEEAGGSRRQTCRRRCRRRSGARLRPRPTVLACWPLKRNNRIF